MMAVLWNAPELADFILSNRCLFATIRPDGRYAGVYPMIGGVDLWTGDETSVSERWSYPDIADGIKSYQAWCDDSDCMGDPPGGWVRYVGAGQPTRRR